MKFIKDELLDLRTKNTDLQELFDLKEYNENKSISDAIALIVEQRLDIGTLAQFRQIYMPRGVCEARFMKVETKAERALQELPLTYVDKEEYNIEK